MPTQLHPSPIVGMASTQKHAAASEIWPFVPCSSQTHHMWEFVPNQTWKHLWLRNKNKTTGENKLSLLFTYLNKNKTEKKPQKNNKPTNRIMLAKSNVIINISIKPTKMKNIKVCFTYVTFNTDLWRTELTIFSIFFWYGKVFFGYSALKGADTSNLF